MKKITSYFLTATLIILAFTGCSKNDSEPAPTYAAGQGNVTGTGGLTFNISGTSTSFLRQITSGLDVVAIAAAGIDGNTSKFVALGFSNISTTGTYPFTVGSGSGTQIIYMSYTPDGTSASQYSSGFTTVSQALLLLRLFLQQL